MFMTIFLSAWTLMHAYVFWRLASVPMITDHVSRWYILAAAVILWASGFLRRFLDYPEIETFVLNWLGALFLLFCCFLITDIVTVFGFVMPHLAPTIRGLGLILGIALVLVAIIQGHRAPVIHDYEVRIAHLPSRFDGLVVAVLSDLHVGRSPDAKWLAARIEQVNALDPDLVLLLGDNFERGGRDDQQDSIVTALRTLSPQFGTFAITGNHESYGGGVRAAALLEQSGIHLLRDEWVELDSGLAVGGVDDGGHGETPVELVGRIRTFLAAKPTGDATIYLCHRPRMIDDAANAGVDLMLSGHTHGGQIWPFDYVVRLFNSLVEGRYASGEMTAIVSRGTGTWGPRMRLWAPGEILRITLRP